MAKDTRRAAGRMVHKVSRCWFSAKYRKVRFLFIKQI